MRCDYGEISQQTRLTNWHGFFAIASAFSAVASISFLLFLSPDTLSNVRDFRGRSRLPRQNERIEKVYPSTLSRSLERLTFLRGFS